MKKLKILSIFSLILLILTTFAYITIEPVFRLWDAIDRDDEKRIRSLKGNQFALNFPTISGTSPLLYAMESKSQRAFHELLEIGENPNVFLSRGRIVTLLAAREKDPYWLRQVLDHGGDPNILNSHARKWRQGYPLNFAIEARLFANAKLLLERNANPNSYGDTIQTPLATASDSSEYETAMLLLDYGADPHLRQRNAMSFAYSIHDRRPSVYKQVDLQKKCQLLIDKLKQLGIDTTKTHWEGEYLVFDDLDEQGKGE